MDGGRLEGQYPKGIILYCFVHKTRDVCRDGHIVGTYLYDTNFSGHLKV